LSEVEARACAAVADRTGQTRLTWAAPRALARKAIEIRKFRRSGMVFRGTPFRFAKISGSGPSSPATRPRGHDTPGARPARV
jgi:hypothetical protein